MTVFKRHISILLALAFFFTAGSLFSADENKELESLQKEIQKYEQELSEKKASEKSTSNLIASLDREIDMTSSMLLKLRRDVTTQDAEIRSRTQEIAQLGEQIDKLRELIKKRLVSFYIHGRRNDVQMLLTGGSWQKANVWLKYQKLVAHNDRRNFQSLVSKVDKLQTEENQLRRDISNKERLLKEQEHRTTQLKSSRDKRQNYLQTVKKDRAFLEQQVRDLEASQREIRGLIESREKERADKQRQISHKKDKVVPSPPSRDYSFSSLQGRLPWPTQGTIISHFGKQRHPTLKTVTENLGIEIRAPLGTPVQCVDAGQVQTITWQRGRGNIIIISHDDGYYTVYTHLADIRVDLMDTIEAGQVIGTVGDSGSLNGPVLHFQIWKNTDNLNPEDWLS